VAKIEGARGLRCLSLLSGSLGVAPQCGFGLTPNTLVVLPIDMPIIRREQMDVLRAAALRGFQDEMVLHLADFSPPLFKAAGEEQIRKTIQLGMELAAGYGFDLRGPVRLYLDLMLLFGSRFDTDPQYPWAASILADRDSGTQMQRAERLWEGTMDYRKHVAGPADAYTLSALGRIRAFAGQPLGLPADDLIPAMLREIALIYPEKAAYVGSEGLGALIRRGRNGARAQGFATVRGEVLVIVLMLAFGHGCGADPLYPWIARTLRDAALTDPEAKAKRLEKKALTWLDQVLAYFADGRRP
jgi:hypothetical protein